MIRGRRFGLLLGALLWTLSVNAKERGGSLFEITHEQALALARKQGPALAIAQERVLEAKSQVEAASVRRFNPEIRASGGPRFNRGDTTADWSIEAQQWFPLGSLRKERMNVARAGVLAAQARSQDAQRLLLRNVSLTFINALYWKRRLGLAQENLRIATEIQRIAQRRHKLGDVGGLEKSVAVLGAVRARSAEDRTRVVLGQVKASIKAMLGIESETKLVLRGDLRKLGFPAPKRASIAQRPDLRALREDIRQADAEAKLGKASRIPNLALGASYSREEATDVVQGTLAISLPLFDHGQGTTAVAQARRQRAKAELHHSHKVAEIETDTAYATARGLLVSVRRFEKEGLAILTQADRLATTSYDAGAIPLGELLSIRRELAQTKLDYTELLFAAATAQTELATSTGTLR